uniref:Uncharacterized protein n=1 Tax=Brassica campestris TaxID=3711 RepID=M4F2X8_BRACM
MRFYLEMRPWMSKGGHAKHFNRILELGITAYLQGPTVRQVPMDSLPDAGNSKLSMSEECPALTIDPSRKSRKQRAYMSSPQAASLADSSTPAFVLEYDLRDISSKYHGQRRCVPNAISFKNCSTLPGGLINGVASRIWGNKFELTATLSAYVAQQVLHSAQYSPKQRKLPKIASSDARHLVFVTSFLLVTYPWMWYLPPPFHFLYMFQFRLSSWMKTSSIELEEVDS